MLSPSQLRPSHNQMHILDLPQDVVLVILTHLHLDDIVPLIRTCRAFASLRRTILKPALSFLNLRAQYHLGPDALDISPIGPDVSRKAAIPHQFEAALSSGSLSSDCLQRFETTLTGETVVNASVFPGGRWLVTASVNEEPDDIEIELPDLVQAMKYRVWDLQAARPGGPPLSPVAWITMPPDESEVSGELWLRGFDDEYSLWIYSDCELREFIFDPYGETLEEKRQSRLDVTRVNASYDIGFHGPYLFNYGVTFDIIERSTSAFASFLLTLESGAFLRWFHFLAIMDDGLVLLDSVKRSLLWYKPSIPKWGFPKSTFHNGISEEMKLLHTIPINGISMHSSQHASMPVVNRPYSTGDPSSALAKLGDSLVHFDIPTHPTVHNLQSYTVYPIHHLPNSYPPVVHAKTVSGHVVAIAPPFRVYLLKKGGEVAARDLEVPSEEDITASQFLCPAGGILGQMQRIEELWLWKVEWVNPSVNR